ncbi:glycosyl hydrolase family 65 protein [Streptomyces sp. NPDC094438]|uniref:glycosyl hydrolase family 65 protein n=1 Tax=Streptomyces sp. NPDC094438 TaxID=3366061 RepID=UPI003823E695
MRYRGHWGVRLQMRPGRLHVEIPASDRAPIEIELPGRTVSVAPGQSCELALPDRPRPLYA